MDENNSEALQMLAEARERANQARRRAAKLGHDSTPALRAVESFQDATRVLRQAARGYAV